MRCPKCGASVADTASWCTSCGAKLDGAPAPAAGAAAVTHTAPGEPIPEALARPESPADGASRLGAKPKLTHVEAGRVIDGKYTIVRVLGEGGMGVVYLARDVHTGGDVVLKSMRPELAHRADIRERTLAEGRALARIDHPNVVHLNAVVADASGLWLVMQFIDGESLDSTIRRSKESGQPIPFREAISLFRQILGGVGAAHREGVIHRDLKPANILVRKKDGIAKVTDFGIAKPEEKARAGKGDTKGVIGSLWYMSPEQVQGKKELDKRVDVYGLGILLFELLTGHVPFDAASSYELMRMHVEDPLPKVSAERKDVPPWVDEILQKACAKNREDRYESCDAMLAAIDAQGSFGRTELASHAGHLGPGTTADAAAITGQHRGGGRSGLLVGALVVLTLGALGVAGWFAFANGDAEPAPTASAEPKSTPSAAPSSAASSAASPPSAEPSAKPIDPADSITGAWESETGRKFDAVRVGASVEFRIRDAKDFAPADYRDGEARFVLTPEANADGAFTVEDKIRPNPPDGSTYDSMKSRNTCQEVWTSVQGKPLRASYDGTRLTVEFAKIAPTSSNFTLAEKKVVACSGLRNVSASRGSTVLTRSR